MDIDTFEQVVTKQIDSEPTISQELISALQCYVIPGDGKNCNVSSITFYRKAYFFWRETLSEGYISEGLYDRVQTLTSDEFLRHEEVFCLFYDEHPVGLILFDWFNLQSIASLDHSYFKIYPLSILSQLQQNQHKLLMTIGSLCVHPDWRKHKIGPGVSEILTNFMMRRFLESPATALLFTTRNNRGTHQLGKEHGAVTMLQNLYCYNGASNIMVVYRDTVKAPLTEDLTNVAEMIWNKKIKL